MAEVGVAGVQEYRVFLEAHPEEWRILDQCCRVTISRFFRDREVFRALREGVFPELARKAEGEGRGEVRCWSAGCGSGEEPYTLSLLWNLPQGTGGEPALCRRFPSLSLEVNATDTDPKVLERAGTAAYPPGALKEVPEAWVAEAFHQTEVGYSLRPAYRKPVRFFPMDVRETAPDGVFGLVLCRNLAFTYFDETLQGEVLERLSERVRTGGFLAIGSHEKLPSGTWPLSQLSPGLPLYRMR
jgi:chemotaxis protein methyltransferase CheR